MKTKRISTAVQRWGAKALTLLLACALMAGLAVTASARGDWQGEVVDPAIPKPIVTIQGNLVTEKGKPTGFYELALCVQSGCTIVDNDSGSVVDQAVYDAAIEADPDNAAKYTVTYYPFRTASAAMNINTDILTAVNWNLTSVTYETYNAATDSYPSDVATPGVPNYPRGIDTDPAVQGYAESGLLESEAFPDITTPNIYLGGRSVALDVEGDARMFTAEGVVEHFENDTALLTLSAAAPDNHPVVLPQSTPLVVARFSYDLKRFSTTKVNENYAQHNNITGDVGGDGFWMGWDKTSGYANGYTSKQALTWLGESTGSSDFSNSDELISYTRGDQAVWVHMGTNEDSVTDQETYFYYYLGAEEDQTDGFDTVLVNIGGVPTEVDNVAIPKTAGQKVLTEGTDLNTKTPQAEYTYFKNLLRLKNDTLVLKLVNEPTFKRPANANDNIILFYDWDDTLIGTLAVGKGDVRAEVEAYIEANLVHPDLRPGSPFMSDGGGNVDLNKVTSLQRDYTYRGKYAYTVGGDDTDPAMTDVNGKEYPLTNKLDYVFTKRVNTTITQVENGATVQYVHPYALNDPALDPTVSDNDAAEFPYVYGWAVVEDTRAFNGKKDAVGTKGEWKVMHDAAKLEDVWTTMGVGELNGMKRTTMTNPTLSTVAVDPAAERFAPVFLAEADPAWTDGTRADADDYVYTISGANSYLRFVDFSDITAELERYEGKNTLIVKAVYEEGESLMDGNTYTAITQPAYTKWNSVAASAGGSYRVQMTVERSYKHDGQIRGTTRVRMPAVQQDTTIDYKWLADAEKGISNDLNNASYDVSKSKDETLYTQVDSDNGEEITFSLALSARQNRVDYVLVERYSANFVTGTQRSTTNNVQKDVPGMFIPDNYNYLTEKDSDIFDDLYDPDFSTKEGSHGFVLYSTLGHFMEQATQYNRGSVSQSTYNNAVRYTNAVDANLRMDIGGTMPGYSSNTVLQNAFLAAALQCEAHKGDPAYDCWDENLDCAKLTYHQAQWFLLDYQLTTGADIRTVADADANTLSFCHYHISCSGGHVPKAPTTWAELMETLRSYNDAEPGSKDQDNAMADLEAMVLTDLENLTSLRSNVSGRKYSNLPAFINALLAADAEVRDAGLDQTWANMQYAILNEVAADADADEIWDTAQEKYWWYAGATTAPKIDDFAGLLKAAETIRKPVRLKDGNDTFLPLSAMTAATLPTGSAEYLTAASPTKSQRNGWVKLTDNLVPGHKETDVDPDPNVVGDESIEYTYERFPDMATFLDLFNTAYDKVLADAEAKDEDPPQTNDAWWEALQIILLPDGDELGVHNGDDSTKFWWKGGNTPFKVINLSTLVECVRRLNGPSGDERNAAQDEWNRLTVADIESAEISQSLRWKGSDAAHPMYPYIGANLGVGGESLQKVSIFDQLSSAVKRLDTAMAANPNLSLTWERVQYLLLNDKSPLPTDNNVVRAQKDYYWWQNGNTEGTKVSLSIGTASTAQVNVRALISATYRADFNDPGVMSSILAATQGADNSFWDYTRLITQKIQGKWWPRADAPESEDEDKKPNPNDTYDGPDTLDEVKAVAYPGATEADVQALLDILATYRDLAKEKENVTDAYGTPTIYWVQVQYWILNNTYLSTDDSLFFDLLDEDTAKLGDFWWYYDVDKRVPPARPEPAVDDPAGPAGPLVDLFDQIVLEGKDLYDDILPQITADMVADWGFEYMDAGHSVPMDFDNFAIFQLEYLYWDFSGDYFMGEARPSWAQMMYYLVSAYEDDPDGLAGYGIPATHEDAVQGLVDYGWTEADFPAGTLTDDDKATFFAVGPIQEFPDGEIPERRGDFSDEEIRQMKDALPLLRRLDPDLARQVEKRLAALDEKPETPAEETRTPATSARPSTGTSVTVPNRPEPEPETPVTTPEPPAAEDNDPVEVDAPTQPEAPAAESTDERVEIPLGEEIKNATRRPIATAGQTGSGYGPNGSVTAERTETDAPIGLVNKVYRLEPDAWKKRWTYAA